MPLDQLGFVIDDVFTLASMIAWLRTKPPEEEYCWSNTGGCLFAQYGEYATGKKGNAAYIAAIEGFRKMSIHEVNERRLGEPFPDLAFGSPRTFGAVLDRALRLQASGIR